MAKVKKQVKQAKKEVPVGVKVISVLYYIGAALCIILGILLIVGAGALLEQIPTLALFGAGLFIVTGIILIALAVLGFFVGRGLWRGQGWARIVAIILAILGFLVAIASLVGGDFTSIISLVINGFIGGYLLFNKSVKEAF